jgi:hypothetical protein
MDAGPPGAPAAMSSPPDPPEYVERGGEIVPRHPSEAVDARLYGFVIQAKESRLNEFCDRTFNWPAGCWPRRRWKAMGDWVMLTFVDICRLRSLDEHDRELGYVTECEGAIWMPVWDAVAGRMSWTIPYIFVNSEWALVGGREPFGFPKQLGKLDVPRGDEAPTELEIRTTTARTFEIAQELKEVPVVRVSRKRTAPVKLGGYGAAGEELVRLLERELLRVLRAPFRAADRVEDAAEVVVSFVRNLVLGGGVSMVLLKQFRDAVYPRLACYQAILDVVEETEGPVRGGPVGCAYDIEFHDLDGEPIHRDLGVPKGTHAARYPFWMEFDFTIRARGILWQGRPLREPS